MDPMTSSALISAGSSILGGLFGGSSNKKAAQAQMEWQERMRATQYQTAVEDMKKAGLNPMLAYSQGGAGNLSGASYSVDPTIGTQAVSSALQAKLNEATIKNMREQNSNIQADTKVKQAQEAAVKVNSYLSSLSIPAALNSAKVEQSDFGTIMAYINAGKPIASILGAGIGSGVGSAFGVKKLIDHLAARRSYTKVPPGVFNRSFE